MVATIAYYMKYIYISLALIIFSSCISNGKKQLYKKVANGYIGLKYKFSDSGDRNIQISFSNNGTIEVTNRTNMAHGHQVLNFNAKYSFKVFNVGSLYIDNVLYSDKILSKIKYTKPYVNSHNNLDSTAVQYIFPNIEGDTIRFSADFQKLQIKEFNFDRVKR
jgi:hypothetical protein